ncbi:hypothetical protein BsWGS_22753 [Bradybaena similaris]
MVGFNKEEKEAILERHNHLRTLPKAKTMLKMAWDSELEQLAQNYADKCIFQHNKDRRLKAFPSVGENLYAGTGNFDPASVVQVWYDEVKDYDYATNKCKTGAMCGHYTQVVWVNSSAVGCGGRYCEHLGGVAAYGFSSGFVVVCNYGPSGNYIGRKPYEIGQPCSLCPEDRKYCAQGLCGLLHSDMGMLTFGEASVEEHPREKREVNKAMVGFNKEEKAAILQRHNHLRTLPKAKNMLKMAWDSELEKLAQNYADKCIFEHNKARHAIKVFDSVGENLYAGTGTFEPAEVVQAWYDEVKDYNYATSKCKTGAMCGHYTQVVWANSLAVGCGVKYCERLQGAEQHGFSRGYNLVCNYGPSGNYVGQKPYEMGEPCSPCPKDRKFCVQGLCAFRPQIGANFGSAQIPGSENSSSSFQPKVFIFIPALFVLGIQRKTLQFVCT